MEPPELPPHAETDGMTLAQARATIVDLSIATSDPRVRAACGLLAQGSEDPQEREHAVVLLAALMVS